MRASVSVDDASDVGVLVKHRHVLGCLNNLKGEGDIRDARDSGEMTLRQGIGGRPLFEIRPSLCQRRRLVRDVVTFHHALPGGHSIVSGMGLEVPMCSAQRLPDAVQVGLAVRCPCSPVGGSRRGRGLRRDRYHEPRSGYHDNCSTHTVSHSVRSFQRCPRAWTRIYDSIYPSTRNGELARRGVHVKWCGAPITPQT